MHAFSGHYGDCPVSLHVSAVRPSCLLRSAEHGDRRLHAQSVLSLASPATLCMPAVFTALLPYRKQGAYPV